MARSIAARYAVGAFAFMAAATWLGVGLISGLSCLFVFVLAFQAVRVYQGRSSSAARRRGSRRERPSRHERASVEKRESSPPGASRTDRQRPRGRIYDGDREEFGRPVASEAW